MPSVIIVMPSPPDFNIAEDEEFPVYSIGTRTVARDTETFYEVLPDPLPDNMPVEPKEQFDTSDPDDVVSTGWIVTTRADVVETEFRGGWASRSDNPSLDTPDVGTLFRVIGETSYLNDLDSYLQSTYDEWYGILDGEAIAND